MENRLFCQECSAAAVVRTLFHEDGRIMERSLCRTHLRELLLNSSGKLTADVVNWPDRTRKSRTSQHRNAIEDTARDRVD